MRAPSGARRASRIAYTAMLGFALLSPMVATAALGQTSTTTVAGATSVPSTVAGDSSGQTTVADATTETTTISSDSSVPTTIAGATDEPVGGVNAGFGGLDRLFS